MNVAAPSPTFFGKTRILTSAQPLDAAFPAQQSPRSPHYRLRFGVDRSMRQPTLSRSRCSDSFKLEQICLSASHNSAIKVVFQLLFQKTSLFNVFRANKRMQSQLNNNALLDTYKQCFKKSVVSANFPSEACLLDDSTSAPTYRQQFSGICLSYQTTRLISCGFLDRYSY